MKHPNRNLYLLSLLTLLLACRKEEKAPIYVQEYLEVNGTSRPGEMLVNVPNRYYISLHHPTACVSNIDLQLRRIDARTFAIDPVATIRNPEGPLPCSTGRFRLDTSFYITPTFADSAVMRIYRAGVLRSADTIRVH